MEEIVKKDVIDVITKAIDILQNNKDITLLKELSTHVTHDSAIFQDSDAITIAIIIYSLSKVIERGMNQKTKRTIISELVSAKKDLSEDKYNSYRNRIDRIVKQIRNIDQKMRMYLQDVLRQAAIKKGSNIYAHGVSLSRVAEILGLSQWDLMSYIGNTNISEEFDISANLKNRIAFAKSLFGVK